MPPIVQTSPSPRPSDSTSPRFEGIVIGVLVGLVDGSTPLVSFPGNPTAESVAARALATLQPSDVGRRVGLMFEEGDPLRPLVMGCIAAPQAGRTAAPLTEVALDGHTVVLRAEQRLELRCGKASITLDKDGAIELRGVNLLSRAVGRNRILGGSIDLN
ncbi:DUF6484 domain-containing protein [Roseateles depolymerans]|uniref:Uncharacterized protein n=1 Tax=Roseateles depolymerans TaxID=76731 RepID=A0A0U3MS13_9BURK|nr:DUF6484 domain-containing protein [Roseateles depolymerans]ALV07114.1 hypothetical protein RD2015_2649 [Roseateles depolymerans]REG20097.1 hypothetical protein DES44_2604 [Roseateles depolymerans]